MGEHYFSEKPDVKSARSIVRLELRDFSADLSVDVGVFSSRGIDLGTRNLLSKPLAPTAKGDLVDIGCGYGPIALTLAKRYPDRRIWAVDINERALALTQHNASTLGLDNLQAVTPKEIPEGLCFGGIYSNPPIRIGKPALHELLLQWLSRLAPEASAYLVVHKHLGSDSLAKWLELHAFTAIRLSSSGGYRILQVSSSTTN